MLLSAQPVVGLQVKAIRDLGIGLDTAQVDGKAVLPWHPGDLCISFDLEDGAWVTLRASGTEPKLKYYLEAASLDAEVAQSLADSLEQAVISDLIQPAMYGLQAATVT
jgi:phosphomannomutase